MRPGERFFGFVVAAVLPWLVLTQGGCRKKDEKDNSKAVAAPAGIGRERGLASAKKVEYPMEVYGDPHIFDQPRIQFAWRPEGERHDTLWSMRLDGSDLRRVIEPKLLFKHGGTVSNIPARSPDNRYVAASFFSAERLIRVLFDLKEKTSKIIAPGGYVPHFQWTDDSKQVLFYMRDGLARYDVEQQKLSMMPMIYSQGLHIMRGKNRILAVRDYGFDIRTFDGELIQKVKLVDLSKTQGLDGYNSTSEDGELLVYNCDGAASIIRVREPFKPIFTKDFHLARVVFLPGNHELIFHKRGFRRLEIESGKIELIRMLDGGVAGALQLINTRAKER